MKDVGALQRFNSLSGKEASDELRRCCGSSRWVWALLDARPFHDSEALVSCSDQAFAALTPYDWIEAFAHHPQIGDIESLRSKFATTSEWAGDEQAGTSAASEATLQALAQENSDYKTKFGFIFIICATGKSAEEMLAALCVRLPNNMETEIQNAAREQQQITRLRLRKLLEL